MKAFHRYSTKVTTYSRWRWDYASEAVNALVSECGLAESSTVADIGSGTGMVARHFVDRARTVFAVEPNDEMRRIAAVALGTHRSYRTVEGLSDSTTLPDKAIHLITVGRALHWFPAHSTRAEFRRILAPDGWLAIFSVPCTDAALLQSLRTVHVEEIGWEPAFDKDQLDLAPLSFYFGNDDFRTLTFAGSVAETWEAFRGRVCSMAAAPAADHPLRATFERALREVFEHHADNGVLHVSNETRIVFGHMCDPS